MQDGYLEPCGCAGLENQKGGLKRRFSMLKQLRDKGWPLIPVDAGGQEKSTGVQAALKVEFSYLALIAMGYEVVGFGENDLKLDLTPIVINLVEESNPLVSANVAIGDFDSGLSKRYKIISKGGMRIGITTIVGEKELLACQEFRSNDENAKSGHSRDFGRTRQREMRSLSADCQR